MDRRKRFGVHYTPSALARFVAERTAGQLSAARPMVLDPACGDGELLEAIRDLTNARLVGYELDPEVAALAQQRLGPDADIRTGDFTELGGRLEPAGFDAIITNPPYVRTQVLGGPHAARLAAKFGLKGRIDLTHPFVAMAPRLLKPGGVLGLLCSNRFLTTRAGANIRALLTEHLDVVELFDLGDTKLFEAAVLPAVVIAARRPQGRAARFASAYQVPGRGEPGDLFAALGNPRSSTVSVGARTFAVEVGTLARDAAEQPWRLSTPERERRAVRVAARTWKTVGELAKIRVGIKTTADQVFIGEHWDGLPEHRVPEADLLRPLLTHEDLRPWTTPGPPRARVLYPYLDLPHRQPVDLGRYPRAAAYLAEHRERLEGRRYLTEAGREWFEIWVPQRPSLWRAPKIVFPDISPEPRFAIDRSGAVVNGDCYWISVPEMGGDDLAHLVLGVANSSFGTRFYDDVCGNRLYAGRRRWITQYVGRLPVPDPATPAARRVVAAVRRVAGGDAGHVVEVERAVARVFE
ncbi:Eco57I restriction-modification methylase domain-containing protein [Actinokineospora pegani]|uniref:Eco57I restriction-modification methylase domain-containing protein n=1 Tax=Actinokineospora pegani TaxID=2654637 RepID=UPI001A9B2A2C|nr:N-6 DNA methylase [Actinokineospora pegani]